MRKRQRERERSSCKTEYKKHARTLLLHEADKTEVLKLEDLLVVLDLGEAALQQHDQEVAALQRIPGYTLLSLVNSALPKLRFNRPGTRALDLPYERQ